MARRLHGLGNFAAHHKWVVLGAWLLAIVITAGLVKELGANTSNNLELPGTDSQAASDLLAEKFPPQQNGANPIIFRAPEGEKATQGKYKEAVQESFGRMKGLPHVHTATSPFSQEGQAQVSGDERTVFISVLLDIGNEDLTEEIANSFVKAAEPGRKAGMDVAEGGSIGSELSEPATESSEVVGMVAAMVILAFTFGTLVAMGMPLVSAVLGLIVGLSLIGLLGNVTEVPTIAPTLATMIGLGVGIDYALFMVSRYRSERAEGLEIPDAIAKAVATSGTAIVFAGGTVVIALVTLLVAGIPLVTSLGYASAFAVVTAVLAAITLLPAVLALVGRHVDSLALPTFLRPRAKREREAKRNANTGAPGGGMWGRWAAFVTGHPGRAVLLALAILLPLTIPFFSLDLGQEDIGATPKDTTERQAYDLMAEGFGPGYNGPLLVAVSLGSPAKPSATFEKQYKRAQGLQQTLEEEQAEGESLAESLESSADEIKARLAAIQAEKDALKASGGLGLSGEKRRLDRSSERLRKQRAVVKHLQGVVKEAARLAELGGRLAEQAQQFATELGRVQAAIRITQDQIARAPSPAEQQRLQLRLDALRVREARLIDQLFSAQVAVADVQAQAASLKARAKRLRAKARRGIQGPGGLDDATQAVETALGSLSSIGRKNQLLRQAGSAKAEIAQIAADKQQLQAIQIEARYQQQQAEKLKSTLTDELTSAGGDKRGTDTRLVALQDALAGTVGVDLVSPPRINKPGDAAIFTVIADTDPADEQTAELVKTVREYVIPQSTNGTDLETHVGGQTASYVDLASAISSKLFLVIFAVITLGFAVLLMAFRSFVVSAQAVAAILLSVCAAFGVVTACFQWGWGLDLVGIDTKADGDPIASFVPLIMFAVLFGLSMDYQVFLMSQIEQARANVRGRGAGRDRRAIAAGLASGAKVISAAALIMISVFASFILNGDPTVKQFGVGLSVGVALAAMSVLLLAPALLVLAGKQAWWVPKWMDRRLPHIDIEGEHAAEPDKKTARKKAAKKKPSRMGSMKL